MKKQVLTLLKKNIPAICFALGSAIFILVGSATSSSAAVPVWNSTSSTPIPENTSAGTTLIGLNATNAVSYQIIPLVNNANSTDFDKFQIVGNDLKFLAPQNFEAPTDSNVNNIYVVVVRAIANESQTADQTISITVTNVNEAPTVTSGTAVSVAENTSTSATVYTATATDPDTATTFTYSISGTDAASFDINSSTGVVTFKVSPNFESPADTGTVDNVYNIIVTATDNGVGTLSDTENVAITVTPVDESAPVITSGATANFAENQLTSVTAYTAVATDADSGTVVNYSISGADADLFNIGLTSGLVTFKVSPNFESPADTGTVNNVYEIIVTASSGTLTDTQTVMITVTNVNEAPTVTSGTAVNFTENDTGTAYTATATDPDTATTITYSISGGADAALFNINSSTGAVTFITAPNFESPADTGTVDNVYNIIVTATDNGAGTLSNTKNVAITVTNVDEFATVITSAAFTTFAENQLTSVTAFTATATDADSGTAIVYSISGGDSDFFNINSSTGVVTFKVSPDFENPGAAGDNDYVIFVTAVAGTLEDTASVTIYVTNVNEAPTSPEDSSTTFAENGTGVAFTPAATTDPDTATTITYTLAGPDAGKFTINPVTGAVFFIAPDPDFESPADVGPNNVYNIDIVATDEGGLSDTQTVAIDVTNVNETIPDLGSGLAGGVNENFPVSGIVYTVTGVTPEIGAIVYSISGGADGALFDIDSSTGAISFIAEPDFENPADSDTNNVYDIEVTATAGPMTDTETVTITVNDVNEAPVITSPDTSTVTENSYGDVVYYAAAADPDTETTITYSISGPDSIKFYIDSMTGEVYLEHPVSWESNEDADLNNVYEIVVTATDGGSLYDTQTVTFEVNNVYEAPINLNCAGTPGGIICDWDPFEGVFPIVGNNWTYEIEVLIGETWTSTGLTIPSNKIFGGLEGNTEYLVRVAHYSYDVVQEYAYDTATTLALPTGPTGPTGPGGAGGPGSAGDSAQTTLVLIVKTSLPVGESAASQVIGGSGTGAITYTSGDTAICTISSTGVVTGVKIGDCLVYATKAASTGFAAAISNPVTVKVTKSLADIEAENKAAAAKAKADADAAAKAKADADAAAAKAKADAAKAKAPTVKKPKVYFAISFAFGSSKISAAELQRIKSLAPQLAGYDIKVAGFRSQTKPGLDTTLPNNRAKTALALLKKLAPTANYTVTSSYSAISSVCNKLVPKANNQCVVIYRTK